MAVSETAKALFERLTGINLLADKMETLRINQEKLSDYVKDHEGRLIRVETFIEIAKTQRAITED